MIPFTLTRKNVVQWILFGLVEFLRLAIAWLKRAPTRQLDVARVVEQRAAFGDPKSVLQVMDQYARDERFLMNVGVERESSCGKRWRGGTAARAGAGCVLRLLGGPHWRGVTSGWRHPRESRARLWQRDCRPSRDPTSWT